MAALDPNPSRNARGEATRFARPTAGNLASPLTFSTISVKQVLTITEPIIQLSYTGFVKQGATLGVTR